MWPTVRGTRRLVGSEARLACRAIDRMVGQLWSEYQGDTETQIYAIPWFDQWDCEQRIWLLHRVALALLSDQPPPPPAAMWEATLDAVFAEIWHQVQQEIQTHPDQVGVSGWQRLILEANEGNLPTATDPSENKDSLSRWRLAIDQIAARILGLRLYQRAEPFRDQAIEQTKRYLRDKGLPEDFLSQMPPLCRAVETEQSVQRIQALVRER